MRKAIGLADGGGATVSNTVGAADAGIGGTISLGAVLIRPIGISPALSYASGEHWFRGNQWPPENTEPPNGRPAPWSQNQARHFTPVTYPSGPGNPFQVTLPPRAWDPVYYQLVLLAEFAQRWTPAAVLTSALEGILANALTPANQAAERHNLIELIEFRAGDLDEVVTQMTTFDAYFRGALGYSASSHPCTNHLVQGAMRVAELVAMYYKNLFQRARPWQLWPELMPPVAVPGHASFPSAHATQSTAIALVLQTVAAGAVPSVVDITNRLDQRIARGREVLGLHYPSDSAAGRLVAAEVATVYLACPTVARLVTAAQQEWASYTA